jgi:hypothetical protein
VALLEPKVERIAPEVDAASPDAAPGWVAAGTPVPIRRELAELLGADRVLARATDIVRYASDASPYRLFPKAVVMAHDADDVGKVLAYARRTHSPVTFLVLRNNEYAILKWFSAIESVEGAPGLDLPALDCAAVATGYGVNSTKVDDAAALREALATAIASDRPELVEVGVAPGMWLF